MELVSFQEMYDELRLMGVTVKVECSQSPDWGGLKFNEQLLEPKVSLKNLVKDIALQNLSSLSINHNKSVGRSADILSTEFKEMNTDDCHQYYKKLSLIDDDSSESGLLSFKEESVSRIFDLYLSQSVITSCWQEVLGLDLEAKDRMKIESEIDYVMEEAQIGESDGPISLHQILSGALGKRKVSNIMAESFLHVVEPVLSGYKKYDVYVAAPDTTWFQIDGGIFFPIIAAERVDGSYEVSIFEGFN